MKIIVYDAKEQRHKFLKGKIGNCFWIENEEDASEYTKEEYELVLKDFSNNKMKPDYTSLGYR